MGQFSKYNSTEEREYVVVHIICQRQEAIWMSSMIYNSLNWWYHIAKTLNQWYKSKLTAGWSCNGDFTKVQYLPFPPPSSVVTCWVEIIALKVAATRWRTYIIQHPYTKSKVSTVLCRLVNCTWRSNKDTVKSPHIFAYLFHKLCNF